MSCCQGDLVWQYNGFHCPFCLSLQFITRAHACKHFIRKFVRKWPRYLLWQFNNAFVSQYTRKKDGFLVEKAFWFTSCVICVQITSGKNCIFFALSCNVEEKKVIWRERWRERNGLCDLMLILYQLQIIKFTNRLYYPLIVVAGPSVQSVNAPSCLVNDTDN